MIARSRLLLAALIVFAIGAKSADRAAKISPETASADFSAEARLTLVPVSVVDRNGAAVLGLQKQHFRIYDNSEPQPIHSLTREDAPVLLGVVLDVSGSMESTLPQALDAIRAVASSIGELDGGFLVAFAEEARMIGPITSDLQLLLRQIPKPQGGTALIDATYKALEEIKRARHQRSALLIVSDGGDNASRHTESELRALAKEADTQIYSISIRTPDRTKAERQGAYFLQGLSKLTGGLHFHATDRQQLPEVAGKIALAMRNVYVISYPTPKGSQGGEWRKIRVALSDDVRKAKTVVARKGYSTPRNQR